MNLYRLSWVRLGVGVLLIRTSKRRFFLEEK
ncbi:hypothetical protein YTXLTZUM_CDS0208 [Enterococcus phage VRE9_3]